MSSPGQAGFVILGKVTGVWGVRGWVKVYSYTREREDIFAYQPWYLGKEDSEYQARDLLSGRRQGNGLVAQLDGVVDREQAVTLVGQVIAVPAQTLPALETGEYYWSQLQGLRVVNAAGEELGVVDHLMETGANDVLVVRGGREHLIPYIPDVIQSVDLSQGEIQVLWDPEF